MSIKEDLTKSFHKTQSELNDKYNSGVDSTQHHPVTVKVAALADDLMKKDKNELLENKQDTLSKVHTVLIYGTLLITPFFIGLPLKMVDDAIHRQVDLNNAEEYQATFDKELLWVNKSIREEEKLGHDTKKLKEYRQSVRTAQAKNAKYINDLKAKEKESKKVAKEDYVFTGHMTPMIRFATMNRNEYQSDEAYDDACFEAFMDVINNPEANKVTKEFLDLNMNISSNNKAIAIDPANRRREYIRFATAIRKGVNGSMALNHIVDSTAKGELSMAKDGFEAGKGFCCPVVRFRTKGLAETDKIESQIENICDDVNGTMAKPVGGNKEWFRAVPDMNDPFSYAILIRSSAVSDMEDDPHISNEAAVGEFHDKFFDNLKYDPVFGDGRDFKKVLAPVPKKGDRRILTQKLSYVVRKQVEKSPLIKHCPAGKVYFSLRTEGKADDAYCECMTIDPSIAREPSVLLLEAGIQNMLNEGSDTKYEAFMEGNTLCVGFRSGLHPEGWSSVQESIAEKGREMVRSAVHTGRDVAGSVGATAAHPVQSLDRATEPLDNIVNNTINDFRHAMKDETRDKIVEGSEYRIRLTRVIGKCIAYGALGVLVHPAVAAIAFLGKLAWDKHTDGKERVKILHDMESESKIVEEKIKDADSKGDHENKYKLMRIKDKLDHETERIRYNKDE